MCVCVCVGGGGVKISGVTSSATSHQQLKVNYLDYSGQHSCYQYPTTMGGKMHYKNSNCFKRVTGVLPFARVG